MEKAEELRSAFEEAAFRMVVDKPGGTLDIPIEYDGTPASGLIVGFHVIAHFFREYARTKPGIDAAGLADGLAEGMREMLRDEEVASSGEGEGH